jgi:Ca2+-binding EF-hand superfamily protein
MKLRTGIFALLLTLVPSLALADKPAKATKAEKAEMREHMLERFDANQDGKLTGKERKKAKHARKRLRHFRKMIARLDKDGDGKLSEAEVGNRFARLQRFDTDHDGWLTPDEIMAPRARKR